MERARCGFRPRSFAESEMGCPLDHCMHCGQHDHEDAPCHEMAVDLRHEEWRDRVRLQMFESWLPETFKSPPAPDVRDMLWKAFVHGLEGVQHQMNAYTMGNCGQKDCSQCFY